ncbi:MAG: inner membrane-spanning protein YciB [Albidovulum sp.]|uniref:inner membrane-spanning protein YciB n=1 Tax=Albidovulum sp. TaxID=1872424 RepID=UPI003C8D1662
MAGKKIKPGLKAGLEFGPILIFFAIFVWLKGKTLTFGGTEYGGFVVATAALVLMIVISSLALWRLTGRLSPMQLTTLVLVIVFGGLSIWLNDGRFIKMKPTLLYLLFAGVLGFGLLRGKSYLALVMEEMIPLQHEGWMIFTRRFTFFFVGLAILNEVIWRTMSDQSWILFKTFGLMALMFVFILSQNRLFQRYEIEKTGD